MRTDSGSFEIVEKTGSIANLLRHRGSPNVLHKRGNCALINRSQKALATTAHLATAGLAEKVS